MYTSGSPVRQIIVKGGRSSEFLVFTKCSIRLFESNINKTKYKGMSANKSGDSIGWLTTMSIADTILLILALYDDCSNKFEI